MAPPQTPIAILVIHGAYFLPPPWDEFIARPKEKDTTVECLRLVSCGDSKLPSPTAALTDDVRSKLFGRPPNAFFAGSPGCLLVQPSPSLQGVIAKYGFQCDVDLGSEDGGGDVYAKIAAESLYNDTERERTVELAKDVTYNWAAAGGEIPGAPWKVIDTVYVHLRQHPAIRLPLQKSIIQEAIEAGGKIRTEELDSGHCAFLSRSEVLVGIVKAAGRAG
ncbi:uncharacterized protein BDV14DRAFT_200928 [Aspergillus stella-maris]|uniref:uncharacterized protein n=1 Tax=Aspergillus stella-maris TaxID=1810926 RepID=UPI003CCDFBC2